MGFSKVDIGKRAIYNYHVNHDKTNQKVPYEAVECWYPQTVHQERIFMLNKLKELSGGTDGKIVELTEQTAPLLFMTAGYDETKKGFVQNRKLSIKRAISRYEDFERKGYIEGDILHVGITFSGLEQLEKMVILDDETEKALYEMMVAIQRCLETSNRQTEQLNQIIMSLQAQNKKPDTTKSGVISRIADISTVVSAVPTLVTQLPDMINTIHKMLSCLGL